MEITYGRGDLKVFFDKFKPFELLLQSFSLACIEGLEINSNFKKTNLKATNQ